MQQEEAERQRQAEEHQLRLQHAQDMQLSSCNGSWAFCWFKLDQKRGHGLMMLNDTSCVSVFPPSTPSEGRTPPPEFHTGLRDHRGVDRQELRHQIAAREEKAYQDAGRSD